jgi:hypothetical protein
VLGGEDDELSPIGHTFELLAALPGPTELVLYQGERHSLGGGPATAFGPNRHHVVANWIQDRLAGQPASDRFTYVDSTGQTHDRRPSWRG